MKTASSPYAGLRVLDLSRVLAGPYATLLLGDLGAEIIKVENQRAGDDTRQFRPPAFKGEATYFLAMNRNKKSLAVDLKHAAGRDLFLELAKHADVIVENFRSGVMERLGIGYEAVKAVRPDIIFCSISGYGRTGSYAKVPGYDPVAQAESGLMWMNGEAEGSPTRSGASHVDMVTGMFAAQAISAALWHRRTSGEGQFVEVCLFDTALNMLLNYGATHVMVNDDPKRSGNGSPVAQPSGTYTAQDGDLMLTVASERVFQDFCTDVIGRKDLLVDERFAANPGRISNKSALDAIINACFAQRERSYWLTRLRQAGVPAGPINSVKEAFNHKLVAERGLVHSGDHPALGAVPMLASPMRLSRTPVVSPSVAPSLGQHSGEILRELAGYSPAQVEELVTAGVVTTSA